MNSLKVVKNLSKVTLAVLCIGLSPLLAQSSATDPFIGTWKLNVAKSKVSPGPAPSSETVTISPDGKMAVHQLGSDGKDTEWSYTAVENTAVPIQGMPEGSTVLTKHVGNSVEHTWTFGTGIETDRGVISKDGKIMTYTVSGTNGKDQRVHDVLVFEKQ